MIRESRKKGGKGMGNKGMGKEEIVKKKKGKNGE